MIGFGLGDKIDGVFKKLLVNPWVNYIYPDSKNKFQHGYKDSYETFLAQGTDLVFAPEKYIAEDLRQHGINAITVSLYGEPTFDSYINFFPDLICQLWDNKDVHQKANKWKADVDKAIKDINNELSKHDIEKKSVFYVRGDKDKGINHTDNVCSFGEYAYRVLGLDYIGARWVNTPQPAVEEVIASNPDIFICGGVFQHKNMKTLHEEPWSNLDAVKNNKIINIPLGFTNFEQLSVMTPTFFYDQANKLYPEYFNYDIKSMVKETIKEYFDVDLSDRSLQESSWVNRRLQL